MRYTISINASLNGKTCKNPQVEFIVGENLLLACEIEDGKITFELPDGADPNTCIEGYIKCEDDCLNCPPQYFKVCLCNDVTALEPCQICVDGFIKDICTPEEIAAGKICTPEGCKCPPTAPITDPTTGQCVQCITGQTSGCKICIAGFWQDIVCPENEVCKDGDCQCAPGYTRNLFTGLCEPNPRCLDDTDCGPCETCVNGECKPVQCPPGFQCWNGECIPGCINTNCSNGADCGPNCGCLNGQCVPCAILSCLDEASCQAALGCECQGDKCGPVNNCGQYCDGNTPCLDENCTCYNNECVSCKNFPCTPDECSDKYNCGCQGGECGGSGGGQGCSDKFELKKNTECSADGCELVANYTTSHRCLCDPIEFKIKNIYSQPSEQPPTGDGNDGQSFSFPTNKVLEFNTRIFKNNIPYENFRSIATMGDDELVDATLKTTITHKVDGNVVTPSVTAVNTVAVDGNNKIPNIVINKDNIATTYNGKGTVVTIEVRAENVKVNSNGCTAYRSKVIATYELDYRNASTIAATNNKINTVFQNETITKVTDEDSTRKPLFVWYKSNTGTFGSNKYMNNGTYNQNGFFRKQYGVKNTSGWTDKINNPAKNSTGAQPNELWNNLNYRATVDCGCGGGSGATLQNVIFCCTENIDYEISNCGKRITVPPFNVCSVNKNLTTLSTQGYTIPQEAQTFFWMIINGTKEVVLRQDGGEVINTPFVYDHDTNISSITFEQRYKGNPNISKECAVDYTEDYEGPDYDITVECGKIVVKKQATSPAIQSVTGKKGSTNITFTASNSNTVWTATGGVLNMNGEVEVTVNFQNSCSYTKKVNIVCQPKVEAIPTDIFAKAECPNGKNPDVVVSVVTGFSAAVKFSKDGITYVDPDSTSPTIKKTFTNIPAGTYTFYAKETINGVEVIDTAVVTILSPVQPTLSKVDICGNKPGSITILGGAPTSTWKIVGPAYSNFVVTLGANGNSAPVTIPIDKPGNYVAQLVSDPTNSTCSPSSVSIDVFKKGSVVSPTIELFSPSICQGQDMAFKIVDGGKYLTYNVSVSPQGAGVIKDITGQNTITQVTASQDGAFNAQFSPNPGTTSASIVITGIAGATGNCSTLNQSSITKNVPINPGPVITNVEYRCSDDLFGTYLVYVTVTGTVTGVTVGGNTTTLQGGVWVAQDIQILNLTQGTVIASNSNGCQDTYFPTELPDCNLNNFCLPPGQTVSISSQPLSPTCGPQTVQLTYDYSTLGFINGQQYGWYKVTGNTMFLVSSGTITGNIPPPLSVTSSYTPEDYMLVITVNGACEYSSNVVNVYADTELAPEISGAGIAPDTTILTTGQTYSYSTAFIPGATYTWTLSNSNGSNQPIGTNSNSITISTFTQGSNIISLTVDSGTCSGTALVELVVDLSCPTANLNLIGSTAGCQHIQASFSPPLPPGITVSSYEWQVSYDNGAIWLPTSQFGTGDIVNFNPIEIFAAETADVRVEVTLSNTCNFYSSTIEYIRCNCICSNPNSNSTSCNDNASAFYSGYTIAPTPTPLVRNLGYYKSGRLFDWELGYDGTGPIRFVFSRDGIPFADTGIITRMSSTSGCTTGSCPVGIQYLGDDPNTSVIMNPGSTQITGNTSISENSSGCDRLVAVGPGKVFISGNNLAMPNDGLLSVSVTTYSATGCGSYGSFSWKLTCAYP